MNTELLWAAGFFDGEGHAAFRRSARYCDKQRRVYQTSMIDIRQKDRRVLDRFAAAVGCGKIYGPYFNKNFPNSGYFCLAIGKGKDVVAVAEKLLPYVSAVKKGQLFSVIKGWNERPMLKTGRKSPQDRDSITGKFVTYPPVLPAELNMQGGV